MDAWSWRRITGAAPVGCGKLKSYLWWPGPENRTPIYRDLAPSAPAARQPPANVGFTGFTTTLSVQPLHGVKVSAFCHVAAGPFCGMLMSDFGAAVTKVKSPEGDAMRQWPPLSDG